jgi:RNA polymerase sigma factor (sigma-70 family)
VVRAIRRSDPLANPEPLIRSVYGYVAYRIGPGPDAQDVTSATLERAIRGRGTYDPAKGPPIAWLIGIARRCLSDALAARPLLYGEPPERPESGNLEADSIRRLTLSGALASLEEREQELIALRYGADFTARRIGEILGMKTNAVEVALHRALTRLRERLDAAGAAKPSAAPDPQRHRHLKSGRKVPGDFRGIPGDTATKGNRRNDDETILET